MPELDPVTQDITADVAAYLAAMDDIIAKAEEVAAAVKGQEDALADLARMADDTAALLGPLASRMNDVRNAAEGAAGGAGILGGALGGLDGKLDDLVMLSTAAVSELHDVRNAMAEVALAAAAMGAGTAAAGAAIDTQAAATDKAGGSVRRYLGMWRLTGNAIHWIVSASIEFLAVALPAAIAAAAGAFVLYQGVVEDVGRRMQALYTTTEATSNLFHKTTGDVLGLGHAFQTAQNAANPIAYQLLGNYINIARQHMTDFAGAGLQVARAVGELGARIQVDLVSHGQELNSLLAHMVPDLIQFGQIFGNIGHAILNLAADMPGLAEKLLQIADAISRVILFLSSLPRWVWLTIAAFEEFNRWGGLLTSIFGRMGLAAGSLEGKFFSLTRFVSVLRMGMSILPGILFNVGAGIALLGGKLPLIGAAAENAGAGMARFASGIGGVVAGLSAWEVIGVAAVAVGLGILIDKLVTARTEAQQFGDSLEQAVAKSSNVNALATINDSLSALNAKTAQASAETEKVTTSWKGAAGAVTYARTAYQGLGQYQQQLLGQFGNVVSGADKISQAYGTSFAGSLALADAAGVKLANTQVTLGKNANIAGAQIEGLVQGYNRLDQVGGTIGSDMNVLAIQSGLAGTQVSKLNSAWDQFVGNATGVTSSLATMNQDLTQIGNVGVAVGKKFTVFSGQTAIGINKAAEALTSFSGKGAQVWQNYDAAISQAQQLTDQFRTAAAYGGVSVHEFNGVIANTVGSLLPFTAHSKTAVAELSAIAQEAGGPATDSFKTLKQWVEANGISAKDFNKDIQAMTGQLSNAGAAAAEFASTLQSQMQQQLAAALLDSEDLNGAVSKFQNAVRAAGGQISTSSGAYKTLDGILRANGLSAKQARYELQLLQNTIDGLHSKSITIGVNTQYTTTGQPAGTPGGTPHGPGHPLGSGATGGYIGGYGTSTSDSNLIRASRGEFMMQAAAVDHYGRGVMEAMNAKRLAAGGIVGGSPVPSVLHATVGGGSGATTLHLNSAIQVKVGEQALGTAQRKESLTYVRRNPQNNLSLRVR